MSSSRYHVFLSYNDRHRAAVEELALWLVREGLTPFFDRWELVPGVDRQSALEAALRDSDSCAVVLGAGEDGLSPWQAAETRVALDAQVRERVGGFRVVPILLPGAEWPEGGLPSFLRRLEAVSFRDRLDDEEALHRLACGVRGIPPGPRARGRRSSRASSRTAASRRSRRNTPPCSSGARG